MRWLANAIAAGKASGKTAAALAAHCGVTPQAVNGWLTTGRIRKRHLAHAALFFGHAPTFPAGREIVAEPDALYSVAHWPFDALDFAKIVALPRDDRLRLEGAFLLAARQLGFAVEKAAAA